MQWFDLETQELNQAATDGLEYNGHKDYGTHSAAVIMGYGFSW
jgi:hypothetical protein